MMKQRACCGGASGSGSGGKFEPVRQGTPLDAPAVTESWTPDRSRTAVAGRLAKRKEETAERVAA